MEVPFALINNLPVVQAVVNGRAGNFVLDTGAEVTLLNQHYFPGVPAATPVGAGATGAFQKIWSYRVSRFVWQGLTVENVDLTAMDLTHLGAAPLLGILGADLLTQYAVTLDYATRTVVLRTADNPQLHIPPRLILPFARRGHLPVIQLIIANQSYDVAIDSGASMNMLTEKWFTGLQGELTNPFTTSLCGAAAQVRTVKGGTLKRAMLAHQLPLFDMMTVFATIGPLAHSQPTPIDGILGYEFLRQHQVTINYPKGVIELR
ncbi:MAG: aspartyl protease family protein [Hymenobacter sp.]|nr:aspartyl protease family protein [Hymenobacter sp.]